MPVRQATRRYADLATFLSEYPNTLGVGALLLPADAVGGEPAPEMKIDLVLPITGRVGPLVAQVVTTLPDGAVALRVVDTPPVVDAGIRQVLGLVEDVKTWLVRTRQLVPPAVASAPPEEVTRLQGRIRELEARLALAGSAPAGTVSDAGAPRVRGLRVPDVADRPPTLSGSLTDRSLRDAFMAIAVERQTGLFTLRQPDGRVRYGFWSKGGPVGWRTEPVEEQEVLGVLLFRAGTITKEQLATSLEIMERSGCRQGEALIEMGLCTFPQLVVMLQKQVDFIFQRVLREHEGTWTFHHLDDLPERFLAPPLRVAAILYRALLTHAREMSAQDLAAALRPWLDHYVTVAPGVAKTFEDMKLTAEEKQFVDIMQVKPYRLRELSAVSSLSRAQTAAAVWSLQDLNLIELRAELEGERERERERFEKNLAARLEVCKAKTLFERLEIHWICTTPEVEAAHRRLKAGWPTDQLVARHGEQYRGAIEEIHAALDHALKTLSNDKTRREYRGKTIERMKIDQSAEMLARQGDMAIMKASWRDATNCFSKALELSPNNKDFKDGLARANELPH